MDVALFGLVILAGVVAAIAIVVVALVRLVRR